MRPAFTASTIQNGGKKLKVVGPIDLDGKESEAYIWLRVTQRKKGALPRVEGIGTADRDRTQLKQEFDEARTRLLVAVKDLNGRFGTGGPLVTAVEKRDRDVGGDRQGHGGVGVPRGRAPHRSRRGPWYARGARRASSTSTGARTLSW